MPYRADVIGPPGSAYFVVGVRCALNPQLENPTKYPLLLMLGPHLEVRPRIGVQPCDLSNSRCPRNWRPLCVAQIQCLQAALRLLEPPLSSAADVAGRLELAQSC